jgi:hypothetical protein
MKIKVESDKIIKAVKRLDGVEIVLENPEDAKEAFNLIMRKADLFEGDDYESPKDVKVTAFEEYKTSAVNYQMNFLMEFLFEDHVPLEKKVSFIKNLQRFLSKT